jgi:3-hydroxyisobutyrate dehydrogenase
MRVAVLGTGIMGAPMARKLRAAGHEVRAWNRSRERAEPLAENGIEVAGSVAKDAELALEAAGAAGLRLGALAAVAEQMRRASADGHGGKDMAATIHASRAAQ